MPTTTELQLLVTAKDQASNTLKKVGGSMEGIASVGKKIAAGLAVAGAAAVAFGISSVKSFNDSEKVVAQLDAVLKSTNKTAGVTREKALEMASALQLQSTFSDEAILSAENMLLTFTNIKDNVFPDATQTVLDMSVALGQDTKNSAIQLGKALNDPITGITALRRVGVTFTEDQKKQIETLVKSGKTMEAQKLILAELGREFGGSAKAQAETFAGKIEILKNQFDDLKEGIGKVIVDALTPFIQKLAEALNAIPAQFATAKAAVQGFFSETSTAGVWLRDVLLPVFTSLRDTAVTAWNQIIAAIQPIKPELQMLVTLFGSALLGAIVAVIIVVGKLLETIIKVAAMIVTAFSQTIQIMKNLFEGFYALLHKENEQAVSSFKKAWEGVKSFFSGLFGGMKDILINAVKPAIDLINKIIAKYNDLPGTKNISEIRLGGKALGGAVEAGMPYVVGEHRPEIFVPSQNGRIMPSPNGVGGSGLTVNIYNPPAEMNVASVVSMVEKALNRKQELTRMGAY